MSLVYNSIWASLWRRGPCPTVGSMQLAGHRGQRGGEARKRTTDTRKGDKSCREQTLDTSGMCVHRRSLSVPAAKDMRPGWEMLAAATAICVF